MKNTSSGCWISTHAGQALHWGCFVSCWVPSMQHNGWRQKGAESSIKSRSVLFSTSTTHLHPYQDKVCNSYYTLHIMQSRLWHGESWAVAIRLADKFNAQLFTMACRLMSLITRSFALSSSLPLSSSSPRFLSVSSSMLLMEKEPNVEPVEKQEKCCPEKEGIQDFVALVVRETIYVALLSKSPGRRWCEAWC